MDDFGARIAALGGMGGAAVGVPAVDDAVGDYDVFFLLDADETHLEVCIWTMRPLVLETSVVGRSRCDAIAL